MRHRRLKRGVDLFFAAVGLVLLSPFLALLALLVRWRLGSPVLFRQERPGLNAKPFTILKFRTMRDVRRPDGVALPDGERLTRFGRFLRASSLDELPEFWNVLRGDMSLVGPRPLRTDYLELYSAEQARRHDVQPGITGWAQVNGRNAASWPDRLAMDVWYVDHWSLALDFHILFRTIWKVIRREGVSAEGHATMPPFRGER